MTSLESILSSRVAGGAFELPMLPAAAAEVARVAGGDACNAKELVALIERDQTLAANVMRVANTPLYAMRTPTATLHQAVGRLGFARVRELALAIACKGALFNVPRFMEDVCQGFRHAFGTAQYSQAIARQKRMNAEEAFLLGLLHDSGEPLLFLEIAKLEKLSKVTFDRSDIDAAIRSHHARVGGMLITKWKIPGRIAPLVVEHHDPTPRSPAANLLRLAELFTDHALGFHDADKVRQDPSVVALGLYGNEVDSLVEIAPSVKAAVEVIQ